MGYVYGNVVGTATVGVWRWVWVGVGVAVMVVVWTLVDATGRLGVELVRTGSIAARAPDFR